MAIEIKPSGITDPWTLMMMFKHAIIRADRERALDRAGSELERWENEGGSVLPEVPAKPQYRPIPGKLCVETTQNRVVTVKRYGTDGGGEYVEVQLAGSYGAHVRLPLSCIRPLTDEERATVSAHADEIISKRKARR